MALGHLSPFSTHKVWATNVPEELPRQLTCAASVGRSDAILQIIIKRHVVADELARVLPNSLDVWSVVDREVIEKLGIHPIVRSPVEQKRRQREPAALGHIKPAASYPPLLPQSCRVSHHPKMMN